MPTIPSKRLSDDGVLPKKKMVKLSPNSAKETSATKSGVVSLVQAARTSPSPVVPKMVKLNSSSDISTDGVDLSAEAIQDRSQRFSSGDGKTVVSLKGTGGPASHVRTQLGLDGARAGDMVGTSEALERPYLRLHFAPDPSTIRPARVLREALNLVKRKWVKGPDYAHASEQLMSIQQDCKLQGLEGDLAFDAYETHARIAIERGEVGDLSRTISALTGLYHSASIKGQKPSANCDEFIAYRMLYGMREENNVLESVTVMLAQLPAATRRAPDVAFATEVGQALLCNDYTTFFRLYEKAPKMTGYIMDFFVDRVRKSALQTFLRSHGPTVDVDHFKRLLCFAKRKDCFRFLREAGVVFTEDKRAVDTKASRA